MNELKEVRDTFHDYIMRGNFVKKYIYNVRLCFQSDLNKEFFHILTPNLILKQSNDSSK